MCDDPQSMRIKSFTLTQQQQQQHQGSVPDKVGTSGFLSLSSRSVDATLRQPEPRLRSYECILLCEGDKKRERALP